MHHGSARRHLASDGIEGEEIETDAFNAPDDRDIDDPENPIEDDDTELIDVAEL